MARDHTGTIDPVVASALSHYQFETLHPFHDGNGRIGRLLIVLQLYAHGTLSEPTLTVSPWFEARRLEYYDRLLAVSCVGEWDQWVSFFAQGLEESAQTTRGQMLQLVEVQSTLKELIRASSLRADSAHALVDYAVANPSFTVRQVERDLALPTAAPMVWSRNWSTWESWQRPVKPIAADSFRPMSSTFSSRSDHGQAVRWLQPIHQPAAIPSTAVLCWGTDAKEALPDERKGSSDLRWSQGDSNP